MKILFRILYAILFIPLGLIYMCLSIPTLFVAGIVWVIKGNSWYIFEFFYETIPDKIKKFTKNLI